jgi:hypothetical protein
VKLTVPKQILPLKNTARATNPPNQNSIVNASSPKIPHLTTELSCKWLNLMGIRTIGMSARILHAGAKMR